MSGFVEKLFDSSMMPHGHCYLWDDNLVSLHVISDLVIALSYFTIPMALIILVKKRDDLHFNYLFQCFALFIFACGATHLIAIYNVWHGAYWFSGAMKGLTAAVSVMTAILVWPMIPKALAIPSNAQLKDLNHELQREVATNRQLQDNLERLVYNRTEDLEKTRQALELQARRFRSLAESQNSAYWYTDASGEFRDEQPSWERFTGQTQASGYDMAAAVAEDQREMLRSHWQQAMTEQKGFEVDVSIYAKHYDTHHRCRLTVTPVKGEKVDRNGLVQLELLEWVASIKDLESAH